MAINTNDLEALRSYLLRFALYQLRDEALAEDAVQETLLAALQGGDSFSGQSSLKTWLTGVLKHKIADAQRRRSREPLLATPLDEEDLSDFDGLFDKTGHWGSDKPRRWQQPEAALEDQQFWQVYRQCAQRMPARSALVFTLREVQGLDIDEICQNLEISATNCSVLLYRARMSLRLCLEKNWFGREGAQS